MTHIARKSRKIQSTQTIPQPPNTMFYNTALYLSISVIDNENINNSIQNQQTLLERYITNYPELMLKKIYTDNGKTGVNFERTAWNELIQDCRAGNINCIVIKDLSRLGRNYIETGDYLERVLPMLGTRLIAVNDCYDSLNTTNNTRLTSNIKNLVNDIYSKDISKKVISTIQSKQKKGEFIGAYAAYGYIKDTCNPNKIIVNPYTAPTVRRIFQMKANGYSNGAVCRILNSEGIPCPARYRYIKGLTVNRKYTHATWIASTVASITKNPVYLGHMAQGKMRKSLCEGKKCRKTKPHEWIIVPNTHEAIVSQDLYDLANSL